MVGPTDEEHLVSLEEVLHRIEPAGLRLKRKKCLFMAKSVVFKACTQWQRRFELCKGHEIPGMCQS